MASASGAQCQRALLLQKLAMVLMLLLKRWRLGAAKVNLVGMRVNGSDCCVCRTVTPLRVALRRCDAAQGAIGGVCGGSLQEGLLTNWLKLCTDFG
jgi:hypothetical protein